MKGVTMPGTPQFFTSGIAAAQAITTTAEVVVATVSGIGSEQGSRTVRLSGKAFVKSGTTTTAVVCRVRKATLTGTVLNDQTGQSVITAAAGSNFYGVEAVDQIDAGTGYVYVLTVTDTGGGTGGTTVYATLDAFVF
jgi:hypothetical protein